jgi:hypothetical protein
MSNENALGEGALGDTIFGPDYGSGTGGPGTQRILYARSENRVIYHRAESRAITPRVEDRTITSRSESRTIFARSEA